MKRLALFLDGTWNDTSTNTNVWRMMALSAEMDEAGIPQRTYYDVGVSGVRGGGFGKGLSRNVLEAYEWLVMNFEKDDEIFIFGFSRGAYTARTLAGFIAKYGILNAGCPLGSGQLFERYQDDTKPTIYELDKHAKNSDREFDIEDSWIRKYCTHAHIKMVGVWDTVGALGIPVGWIEGYSSNTFNWMHTGLRTPIQNAFHAVAIDEHRGKFAPTLWTIKKKIEHSRKIENVEQRWFPGAHANVGGGYPSDTLAQRPLRWMMKKAENLGLKFKRTPEQFDLIHQAEIADSYTQFMSGLYRLASSRHYRLIGVKNTLIDGEDSQAIHETIDRSVFERMAKNEKYRPPSILKWAGENDFSWENCESTVFAIPDKSKIIPMNCDF